MIGNSITLMRRQIASSVPDIVGSSFVPSHSLKFRYVFEQVSIKWTAGNSVSTRHRLNFAFGEPLTVFSFRRYGEPFEEQMR